MRRAPERGRLPNRDGSVQARPEPRRVALLMPWVPLPSAMTIARITFPEGAGPVSWPPHSLLQSLGRLLGKQQRISSANVKLGAVQPTNRVTRGTKSVRDANAGSSAVWDQDSAGTLDWLRRRCAKGPGQTPAVRHQLVFRSASGSACT